MEKWLQSGFVKRGYHLFHVLNNAQTPHYYTSVWASLLEKKPYSAEGKVTVSTGALPAGLMPGVLADFSA